MKCQACGHDAAGDSRFCPECGAPLPDTVGPGGESAAPDARVQPILATANLLRMRGRWEEAIGKCVEAMRISPNNPAAHALIGDIYSEQGRDADALQWYQMAVELDPDNLHDRGKVEGLLAKLEAASPEPVSREELLKSLPAAGSDIPKGGLWSVWWIVIVAVAVLLGVAALKYLPGGRPEATPAPTGITLGEPQPGGDQGAGPVRPTADSGLTEDETPDTAQKMTMEEAELLGSLSSRPPARGGEVPDRYDAHFVTMDLTRNTCEVTVTAMLERYSHPISRAKQVALEAAGDVFEHRPTMAGVTVRVFGDFPPPSRGEYGRLALIGYVRLGDQTRFERLWTNPYLEDSDPSGSG